jgi:hypothetical protein
MMFDLDRTDQGLTDCYTANGFAMET